MKKATILINGMHCASCASNIERSLKKVSGVKNASVSLLFKKGTAEMDDNVSEESLRQAVKRTGYEAKEVKFN